MVLFLASMQNIPPDLYEAARLDGASRWQEFRDVTLPGIRPTLVFMILMTTIWSFLTFDYIWILTQGGPAGASEVLAVLVFKEAFRNFDAGYAAAIGLTMSFFVGCVIAIFSGAAAARVGDMSAIAPARGVAAAKQAWRRTTSFSSCCWSSRIGPLLVLAFNSLKTTAEIGRNPLGPPQRSSGRTSPKPGTSATLRRPRATAASWSWERSSACCCWAGWRPTAWPSSICPGRGC